MGGLAKFVTTLITYPIQLMQNRLRVQKQRAANPKKYDIEGEASTHYTGVFDGLAKLWRRDGLVNGLYKGIGTKLWQTSLMAAVKFLTYEEIARLVFFLMMRRRPHKA